MTLQETIVHADSLLPGTPAPEGERDERWQAIISVSEFIKREPALVWAFALKWGAHEDEDLRAAISSCLLEHLLEHHFDTIFPLVEQEVCRSPFFAETFRGCWQFGQAKLAANAARFEQLMRQCDAAR